MASELRVNTLTDASSNNSSVAMATVAQGSAKVRVHNIWVDTNTLQTVH